MDRFQFKIGVIMVMPFNMAGPAAKCKISVDVYENNCAHFLLYQLSLMVLLWLDRCSSEHCGLIGQLT